MKNFTFPRSRIILPAFRSSLADKPQEKSIPAIADEDRSPELQRLLETSMSCGTVIRLITTGHHQTGSTTGIVKAINPGNRKITIETLEGSRTVHAGDIIDIREA